MKRMVLAAAAVLAGAVGAGPGLAQNATIAPPAAIIADGVPAIPAALAASVRPYLEARSASFSGWTRDGQMLVATRFANTVQLHRVRAPGADRTQLTFETEPVAGGSVAPRRGDVTLIQKDVGGNEFYQLYRLEGGRLGLLTDGKSRNALNAWSDDGALVAFSSTRRNGTDTDLYVMDPRVPASAHMVAQVSGGGWRVLGFMPGNAQAVVGNYLSVQKTDLFRLDLATGAMVPIGDHAREIAYGGGQVAPDGTLWVLSDEGSDFQRLGTLDPATGRFTPRAPEPKWDVDSFELSRDGRTIAYTVNVDGANVLRLYDVASGRIRTPALPLGTVTGLGWSESGVLGFTLASAQSPADAWSLDPATPAVTRWTQSETGGLDPTVNVEPRLVAVRSFDGERVSGFLYQPDPTRWPGKRPLIVNIHGGPEGQSQPGFMGRTNYLINELGIAIFYPNVRGSTGYGKRFVALDNGPFKREDSVKDIGAFLDSLAREPAIDVGRIAVTGGSYGGYMCYASAIAYGARLKGAACAVAISNFVTFLENTQGYRRDLRRVEYGDERVPAQRAKLTAISPLTRATELRISLLVVTGANDPRVPPSEADQIVAAVRGHGGTAWHIVAKNEGHGYAKKENQDYQFLATLAFWQQVLGVKAR